MSQQPAASKLYLYCVIPSNGRKDFGEIGIGGPGDRVRTIEYRDIAAVVSTPTKEKFERTEENIIAHQRVVQRVFEERLGIPLPFATITKNQEEVLQLLKERYEEFKDKLLKLGPLNENGRSGSSFGARELLEEALSQSAASAIRIRQLSEEINQLRAMRYEKTLETAAELVMRKLSTNLSATLNAMSDAIFDLQGKLEKMREELSKLDVGQSGADRPPAEVPSLDKEVRLLREEMQRLNRRQVDPQSIKLQS